jgi:hypothetical protein
LPGTLPRDRSIRGQLQRQLGDAGAVQPYRWSPDRAHPAVGWYVAPTSPATGCRCGLCTAARASRDVFLGSNLPAALRAADDALRAHHAEVPA